MRTGWALFWLWTSLSAGENPFIGPAACAPCHPAEYEKQSRSHHARALRSISESAWPKDVASVREGDFTIRYEPRQVSVERGGEAIHAPLVWAFGAGAQGITPVGLNAGVYFEHRFSYYSEPGRLAPTFGHPNRVSSVIAELGVPQDRRTIFQCFHCHSTGVRQGAAGPDLADIVPGVTCERCHGPGRAHVAVANSGASRNVVRQSVVNPGRFPARSQVEMCGECHRLPAPDTGPEPEMEDPVTVRFAPVGLMASRCFSAGKKLSCITCHDPHTDARPRSDAIAYGERCRACHQAAPVAGSRCRRAESLDCISCHMPKTSLGPYLRFTDHRIRVVN